MLLLRELRLILKFFKKFFEYDITCRIRVVEYMHGEKSERKFQ